MQMDSMEAVQATNDDASGCKRYAVSLNYWNDDYIQYFVRNFERKAPEISRGYFARISGVNSVVKKFAEKAGSSCQIVNLGAGYDTLFWRLKANNIPVACVIDIDFPSVAAKKCYTIKRSSHLLKALQNDDGDIAYKGSDLHSFSYHVIGVDLRKINELECKLVQCRIDFSLPTLFISECVLVYIEYIFSQKLLSWISSKFPEALLVNYEQINMSDKFGDIMARNLRERGCTLAGLEACKTTETQMQRFLKCGWDGSKIWDMMQIYSSLPISERQRIEAIEFLDEQELLVQLLQHYSICIAWKGDRFNDLDIT